MSAWPERGQGYGLTGLREAGHAILSTVSERTPGRHTGGQSTGLINNVIFIWKTDKKDDSWVVINHAKTDTFFPNELSSPSAAVDFLHSLWKVRNHSVNSFQYETVMCPTTIRLEKAFADVSGETRCLELNNQQSNHLRNILKLLKVLRLWQIMPVYKRHLHSV